MPVPFLIAGRIQNVQTCLFGVFAVQDRQPLEQQVRIINHLAGAAGHDAGGQAAGGNHGQRLAKFSFHAGSQAVQHGCGAKHHAVVQAFYRVAANQVIRRFGRDRRQLRCAAADGPQAGLHAGQDKTTQERPLGRNDIIGGGRAKVHRHAGQGIVGGCGGGIGNAVPPHAVRSVHRKGQPGVQCRADQHGFAPGQPGAGIGQNFGQVGHHAAHDNALTGFRGNAKAAQQKFQLGGVFIPGAARAGDHARGEQHLHAIQPANADVAVTDINCKNHRVKPRILGNPAMFPVR